MAYNSSGVYSRVHDFTDDRDNGIKIQASRMDAEMDGLATGLTTALTKNGSSTTTAIVPFAVGLSIIDNQSAIFGTNSDYTLQYDEATRDSLFLTSNIEGAAFKLTLAADQGDDASDEWQIGINTSGVLSIGNDINSAQTYVSQITLTPNATVANSTTAVLGNLTVGGSLTLGSAVIAEAELELLDGITAGTVIASKAIVTDSDKDITGGRNITISGELDAAVGDFSGNVDVAGTLSLSGTAVTATATLATGISNTNVPKFTTGVANDDFLRVNGTLIEGRSATEVLSDVGGQAALTFGISNTNAVKVDSASVADDEFARFTANGLESRSVSEVRSDIGLGSSAVLAVGISNTNVAQFGSGVADDDFLRINGTTVEGRSASELASDIGAATEATAVALALALG